jgi:hypothetical protein
MTLDTLQELFPNATEIERSPEPHLTIGALTLDSYDVKFNGSIPMLNVDILALKQPLGSIRLADDLVGVSFIYNHISYHMKVTTF